MKKILLLALAPALILTSCASNPHDAKYKEEKNAPKFANSNSFVEAPDEVMLAARAALDDLSRESEPPTSGSIKQNDETITTGWVYGESKNQYVEYKVNKIPKRKPLRFRRKYGYTITPSLAGSEVVMQVEEEILKIDLKTGEEKGWSSTDPDRAAYDLLTRRLKEKLRSM